MFLQRMATDNRPMHTLFIVSLESGYGGAERSIEIALQHLPHNLRVRVYAQAPEHLAELKRLGTQGNRLHIVPLSGCLTAWGRKRIALRLAYDVWRQRPRAVLLNTQVSALVAAMAARLLPDFGRICHLYVRDFMWRDLDLIFKRLRGAGVLVPSQAVLQRWGYLAPAHVAPWGTAPVRVMPCMVPLPSGPIAYDGPFLHLATVNAWKGHMDLLQALQRVVQAQPQSEVNIVSCGVIGNDSLHRQIVELIPKLNLSERFQLAPYTPDPTPLLRDCRAVLVPSVSHSGGPETFGRTVIEAWAFRKPVVAYATGAPAQMIRHGVDGLLVPEGDIAALEQAIWQLHQSPEQCRQLGEAGHRRIAKEFEAGLVTRRLMQHLGCVDEAPEHAEVP
jgi:glycosyltransferase involved in cell wall biosynthesis